MTTGASMTDQQHHGDAPVQPAPAGQQVWPVWKLIAVALVLFVGSSLVAAIMVALAYGIYAGFAGLAFDQNSPYFLFPALIYSSALMFLASIWVAGQIGCGAWTDVLKIRGPWAAGPAIAAVVVGYAINVCVVLIAMSVTTSSVDHMLANAPAYSMVVMVLAFIAIVIGAPVAEEMFFRGWLFTGLQERLKNPLAANVITTSIWALGHIEVGWIAPVALLAPGLIFGWLRLKYNSIWPCILAHGGMNLIVFVTSFVKPG